MADSPLITLLHGRRPVHLKCGGGGLGQPAATAAAVLQNFRASRSSRNAPSFAVALNCGIGSSSLNADVNALDRLHMVRGRNSSYCGSEYKSFTRRARCFGTSSSLSMNAS